MGLFGFGRKEKQEVKLEMAPLGYWEEQSYMIAIPKEMNKDVVSGAKDRINSIRGVELKATASPSEEAMQFTITYDGEEYNGGMYVGDFSMPNMCGKQDYYFTKEEWEDIAKAKTALTVFLKFNHDAKKSFHLQLKLMVALVPDLVGVMDESAERMLCARWVKMAAESEVTPGPNDMYIVQAVGDKGSSVWLHTHGLCRCGLSELEIVDSDEAHYNSHYNVLNSFARILLDKKEEFEPKTSSAYIGVLDGVQPVVATYVPWTEGLKEYPHLKLGGPKDRAEGHNSLTSLVFLYTCEEDEDNRKLSKVSVFDDLWEKNPIFFFSNEETNRMRKMARERFGFVKQASEKGYQTIIKIGLPVDEGEEGECEHIWFELKEFDGDRFKATLTQEPYRVSGIHTGDERWFTVSDVTDWVIYTEQFPVTPDKAYILAE